MDIPMTRTQMIVMVIGALAAFSLATSTTVYVAMTIMESSDILGVILGLVLGPIVGAVAAFLLGIGIRSWFARLDGNENAPTGVSTYGVGQIAFAVLGSALWFYFRTKAYLAGPSDDAPFFRSWDTQLLIYITFWLPLVVLCTGLLVALQFEWTMFYRQRKNRAAGEVRGTKMP
ncbi:hypothetical protein [Chitinimonas koreensis]|uniref:hypothetical protein n=1 Tax=Chitinimonas koreensis TaxID=356302 RepID=UPI0012FB2DC2|nr:hypothetical protein [Chitinimonas koreensis]QNM98200.1 hypothetical protein H9L41_08140 [Chitinimonas koreensis]